jgi:hypothetical protein
LDLKTAIPLSLGLYGIYRLIAVRPLTMPAAMTMIWWAYNALVQNREKDK